MQQQLKKKMDSLIQAGALKTDTLHRDTQMIQAPITPADDTSKGSPLKWWLTAAGVGVLLAAYVGWKRGKSGG